MVPPPVEAGGGVPVPILDDQGEVEHWGIDARGRRYRVDEFGHRLIATSTTRPPAFPADDWKRLSVKQRERAIAEYRDIKDGRAKAGGDPPAVLSTPLGLAHPDDPGVPILPRDSHDDAPAPGSSGSGHVVVRDAVATSVR